MKRHNPVRSEYPPLDSSRRRRKRRSSARQHFSSRMCSPPSRGRIVSRSPTRHRKSSSINLRNVLWVLIVITISSSCFVVVRYHALTSVYQGDADMIPIPLETTRGIRRRRRTTHANTRQQRPPTSEEHNFGMSIAPVEYRFYQDSNMALHSSATNTIVSWKTLDPATFCGTHARMAAQHHGYMASPLNKRSKVVVTGILTPLGVSLALRLQLDCHVEKIIGVDPILPNTRHGRMKRMDQYELLQRNIPNLPKLIVPQVGIPLEELLQIHKPTHVVHLVDAQRGLLENVYNMNQVMSSMVSTKNVQLVYVTFKSDASANAVQLVASTYHQLHPTTAVGLKLPHVYGDADDYSMVSNMAMQYLSGTNNMTDDTNDSKKDEECLFVDDAVDAVLSAMQIQPPGGFATFDIASNTTVGMLTKGVQKVVLNKTAVGIKTRHVGDNAIVQEAQHWLGWSPATVLQEGVSKLLSLHLAHKYPYGGIPESKQLSVATPPQRTLFPCASECARQMSCQPTMLDATAKLSRKITRGCKYVVYTVDLWPDVKNLPSGGEPSDDADENEEWCRIAFVSNKSPLVKHVVKATTTSSSNTTVAANADKLNGNVQWKKWALVWIDGDATSMTEAEYSLLKLSPKRFFSDTVSRAMYVQLHRFPIPSFESLVGYFKSLDPGARNSRRYKEYRTGVNIFRWLTKPARKARRVVLSSLEASFHDIAPKSPVTDYVDQIVEQEGIRPNPFRLSPQLAFYTYAAHFVQTSPRRPEHEIRSTIYKEFPFHWLKTIMMVHDLKEEESRNLRCEWYDEHLFWGNSHLEDVSLAYVLGKRRIMGRHAVEDDTEAGWTAIMNTPARNEDEEPEPLVNDEDMELFLRILPKPKEKSTT